MATLATQIQCPNPKCHKVFLNSTEAFCPECGTRMPQSSPVVGVDQPQHAVAPVRFAIASKARRIAGFLIDIAIASVFLLFLLVPVLGQFVCGIVWTVFFLFRDINGASPGKMILGNEVISKDGRSATSRQKILRNVLPSLPDLAEIIPFVGLFAGPLVLLCILSIEALVLLATGERLSDKIAGTIVVKKRP